MTSHRRIFRSSAIIGGASVINMTVGIIKVKLLAVLLGPAGVGLMGLYQNILGIASSLAGCGISSSGVRQLAASSGEKETLSIVRRALWLANLLLGLIGMAVLWIFREPVAEWVFGDAAHHSEVGWLGVGVLLTLVASSQTALLQGLRRIGDLAKASIYSSVSGAAAGILAIHQLGENGVLWFVLTAPAVSILIAGYYASLLPRPQSSHDWDAIVQQWQAMLKLGIPLMAAGLLTLVTQLATRSIILRELGLDASGYFQASFAISMTYIGFVLGAMSSDYLPRLSEAINDYRRARILVNEQAEMALLLAAPVLLSMITFAPWIIHLLYADSFSPTTEILRWQVLGDILKIASWPMGFIVLAAGRGGIFIGTQLIWNAVYLGIVILGIREWGLLIAGMSFSFAYLISYGISVLVAFKLIGFKTSRRNWLFTLLLLLTGGLIMYIATQSVNKGYAAGMVATMAAGTYSLRRLDRLMDLRGWLRMKFGL